METAEGRIISSSSSPFDIGWKGKAPRSQLQEEMRVGNIVVGSQIAVPIPTRQLFAQRLSSIQETIPQREQMRQAALKILHRQDQDWMHAHGPRDTFTKNGGPSDNYAFVEIPNCYFYQVNIAHSPVNDESFHWLRVPVMSDYRNGSITLQDLEASAADSRTHIAEDLEKTGRKSLTAAQKTGLAYARTLLTTPQDSYIKRHYILEQQMLFYLEQQLAANPDAIKDGSFTVVHMSLLNFAAKSFSTSGWMHDEGKEAQEMSYLFAQFNGKTLYFDAHEGRSYIDEKGIHVPVPRGKDLLKPVTLNTCFFNISVQNHTFEAVEKQNVYNFRAFQPLTEVVNRAKIAAHIRISEKKEKSHASFSESDKKDLYKDFLTLNACNLFNAAVMRLSTGHSTYARAFDIGAALALLQIPFSTGCQSAKDRTGVTSGGIAAALVQASLQAQKSLNELLGLDGTINKAIEKQIQNTKALYDRAIDPKGINHMIGQINDNRGFLLVNPLALARTRYAPRFSSIRQIAITLWAILTAIPQHVCKCCLKHRLKKVT